MLSPETGVAPVSTNFGIDSPKSYGYTEAWVEHLCTKLGDSREYQRVTGVPAVLKDSDRPDGANPEFA